MANLQGPLCTGPVAVAESLHHSVCVYGPFCSSSLQRPFHTVRYPLSGSRISPFPILSSGRTRDLPWCSTRSPSSKSVLGMFGSPLDPFRGSTRSKLFLWQNIMWFALSPFVLLPVCGGVFHRLCDMWWCHPWWLMKCLCSCLLNASQFLFWIWKILITITHINVNSSGFLML